MRAAIAQATLAGMSNRSSALRLSELSWMDAAAWFRRDPRLIVPVATCMQHGPHLPLGADAIIVESLAGGISSHHNVLVAPTLSYGAASERDQEYAGTAAIGAKTLHRVLNDLVAGWERHGVREFVLITAQGFGSHFGALVSVIAERARIRAVDINAVDLSGFLTNPDIPERAGELETSLLLHLAPQLVHEDRIEDTPLERHEVAELLVGSEPMPPPGSPGVVGNPTFASADKGRRIYDYLVEHIGSRLFGQPQGSGNS